MVPDKADYSPTDPLQFQTVEIYGLASLPHTVRVNGVEHSQRNIRYFNKVNTHSAFETFTVCTGYLGRRV